MTDKLDELLQRVGESINGYTDANLDSISSIHNAAGEMFRTLQQVESFLDELKATKVSVTKFRVRIPSFGNDHHDFDYFTEARAYAEYLKYFYGFSRRVLIYKVEKEVLTYKVESESEGSEVKY